MKRRIGSLVCAGLIFTAACSRAPSASNVEHVPAAWSYDGESAPERWNKLDSEYANCGFGTTQSPIDIIKPEPQDLPDIVFHYQPSRLDIENIGYTAQVNVVPGSSIEVNDESYDLVSLQFHVPGEHRIQGKSADAEVQLIHRNAAGQLATIAVLFRIGREDKTLHVLWDNIPTLQGSHKAIEKPIQLEELLPTDRRTFRYEGSLTVPPCTEIVTWLVMRDAMHVSAKQLEGFTRLFGHNNRPVQQLNHRMVIQDTSSK